MQTIKNVQTVAMLGLLAAVLVAGCSRSSAKASAASPDAANRAVPVAAAAVTTQDVPVYLQGLGNVTGYNTVSVKARVDGQLISVNFKEGQEVKKGDLLAQIDPRPFQAVLDQAKANLAKDQAALTDAKTNLARYEALVREKVLAQQQLDTQRSQVGQIDGQIAADQAQIENAALQLSFTRITAPIPGRLGLRQLDQGNMIHASDPNGLVVITQVEPIAVLFSLPEDQISEIVQQSRKGHLNVEIFTRDDKTKIADGTLESINNVIDPTTGTNKFKAVVQNRDRSLWPNEFVNVHLLLSTMQNALTIPAAALQRGSQGTFVYVVKPDKSVEARPVKVAISEGTIAAISDGLQKGEMVVTDGQDRLQPGAKVALPGEGGGRQPSDGAPGKTSRH